jgi:hypothetical protein
MRYICAIGTESDMRASGTSFVKVSACSDRSPQNVIYT